jgi:hypothetical protein
VSSPAEADAEPATITARLARLQEKGANTSLPSSPPSNRSSLKLGPTTLKIPRKRPVAKASNSESNGYASRPLSAASSDHGSSLVTVENSLKPPHPLPQTPNGHQAADIVSHKDMVIPKANVIEPSLLLSYLSRPKDTRPSILLLDVRAKEQYDKGCLNAEYVVWIDPILLDDR